MINLRGYGKILVIAAGADTVLLMCESLVLQTLHLRSAASWKCISVYVSYMTHCCFLVQVLSQCGLTQEIALLELRKNFKYQSKPITVDPGVQLHGRLPRQEQQQRTEGSSTTTDRIRTVRHQQPLTWALVHGSYKQLQIC
jgi:hypothetical protein